MKSRLKPILRVYNTLLPLLLIVGVIPWIIKMLKRNGLGTGLLERISIFKEPLDFEPTDVVYIHAVSVGEVMIAQKLIAAWLIEYPNEKIVLAVTTATGHSVALKNLPENVRIIYSPIDIPWVVHRVWKRFLPKQIILMESEIWPNLLYTAWNKGAPIGLANARLSPRSERRYKKLRHYISPFLELFETIGVTEEIDLSRWESIGARREALTLTGSIKFDQSGSSQPNKRNDFQQMLDMLAQGRSIVMALSTHPGEEALIAKALQKHTKDIFCVIVPRHAERRNEVRADLQKLGYDPVLRSAFHTPPSLDNACFVVDSTGELRDWTAHADIAIIGKSFLSHGGQNPTEAIAAKVPVITGPHMQNFEPLITTLERAQGIHRLRSINDLAATVADLLQNKEQVTTDSALQVLDTHTGATERTVLLTALKN